MNRRSFLKRLGLVPAAAIAAKVALPEKATPLVPSVPFTPQPTPIEFPVWLVWTVPYWQWQGYMGCPACTYPTGTSAAHTHPWTYINNSSNTTNISGNTNGFYVLSNVT